VPGAEGINHCLRLSHASIAEADRLHPRHDHPLARRLRQAACQWTQEITFFDPVALAKRFKLELATAAAATAAIAYWKLLELTVSAGADPRSAGAWVAC